MKATFALLHVRLHRCDPQSRKLPQPFRPESRSCCLVFLIPSPWRTYPLCLTLTLTITTIALNLNLNLDLSLNLIPSPLDPLSHPETGEGKRESANKFDALHIKIEYS